MQRILKILSTNKEWLLLAFVLWFAYFIRIFGVKAGLPYPWHCDEPHLLHTALRILQTGDYNPHDSTYPNLLIYVHTINAMLCYISILTDPLAKTMVHLKDILTNADTGWYWTISHPVFYEWGRRLTVIFATLSVGLVYVLSSRYYSSLLTAILSSLFLACCIGHLNVSTWATVDVPTAFFILATAFSSLLLLLKGGGKLYLFSGLLAGLSIACKYNSWPVVLLPLLGHMLRKDRSRLFSSDVLLILGAIPFGFLIGCPYSVLDLPGFFEDGAGWAIWHYTHIPGLNLYNGGASPEGGRYTAVQQLLYYYHGFCEDQWAVGGGGGVGTFVFFAAILGMASGFFISWRVHIILLAYPVTFVLYMSTMQGNFMRNMTAVNAFLCIFAGLFISQVLNAGSSFLKKRSVSKPYRHIITGIACLILLIAPFYKAINWAIQASATRDSRVEAVEWLQKNVKKTEKIAIARELRLFTPDLEKLGLQYEVLGQLEKDPAWYKDNGFAYIVVGRNYSSQAKNPDVAKYNRSFPNTVAVKSFGKGPLPLDWFPIAPSLDIIKIDAHFPM